LRLASQVSDRQTDSELLNKYLNLETTFNYQLAAVDIRISSCHKWVFVGSEKATLEILGTDCGKIWMLVEGLTRRTSKQMYPYPERHFFLGVRVIKIQQ
jgi:hypothetical protein